MKLIDKSRTNILKLKLNWMCGNETVYEKEIFITRILNKYEILDIGRKQQI